MGAGMLLGWLAHAGHRSDLSTASGRRSSLQCTHGAARADDVGSGSAAGTRQTTGAVLMGTTDVLAADAGRTAIPMVHTAAECMGCPRHRVVGMACARIVPGHARE